MLLLITEWPGDTLACRALYLALNKERVLADFIHFHIGSWGFVLLIKIADALICWVTLDTNNFDMGIEFGLFMGPCVVGDLN